MLKYILKRILLLIPVLIGATFIVFFVMDMTPGDPAVAKLGVDATAEQIEELREEMGLNDPFPVRYGRFVLDLVQGDLGTSYKTGLDVMQQIMQRIPYTFLLSFAALLFAVIVGIPAGIISARHQYTVFDNCTMVLTLIGASAPHFWLGLMGVIIFAVNLGWLPAAYTASDSLALGIILPMLTLGMNSTALVTRMTRSAMLDVMNQDYVDTARAKGVSERVVVFRHMLRNALIPIITVLGLQFGNLLGGAVTTETIFAWPGIGRYIVESISNKDTPCVLGAVVMLAIIVTVINLLVDIIYAFVDLFITHNLSVVKHLSNQILVMYLGQLVEKATPKQLFKNPVHPYTQALLSAIPIPDPDVKMERVALKGELTSPINVKPGCRFAKRCIYARPECSQCSPQMTEVEPGHIVACHLAGGSMK